MIVIGYDGSPDAPTAVDRAGELFGGEAARVLTVWEPFIELLTRTGGGAWSGLEGVDIEAIDAASATAAETRAQEGAERAKRAGLAAQPCARPRDVTVAEAILAEAEQADAKAIVVGTRGLTGLRSLMLGSVSHAVLQHADRPVVVVRSPESPGTSAGGG
jgi:nucleotide-binding universal stress UspA family protein